MTDVFIREAKLLALRRLRGVDPPPEHPRAAHSNNSSGNNSSSPTDMSAAAPYLWARPQVTLLWSQLEQASAAHHEEQRHKRSAGGLAAMVDSDSVPYLVYRQTVCRELARELGYSPEDAHKMSLEERSKVLSMYRQHLCAGPANFFDLWRATNEEALRANCVAAAKPTASSDGSSDGSSSSSPTTFTKAPLHDPTLVDLMSQVGAVGFFADLRSLLDGIRVENTTAAVEKRMSSRQSSAARSASASPENASRAAMAQRMAVVKANPALRHLFQRLQQRYSSSVSGRPSTPSDSGSDVDQGATSSSVAKPAFGSSSSSSSSPDDLSATTTLTLQDLESFVRELLPNIRGARDAPPWLQPYFVAHAVARIAFDADPNRRGKLTTNAVLQSPALTDLLALHESHAPDAALTFPRDFPVNIAVEHAQLHHTQYPIMADNNNTDQEEAREEMQQLLDEVIAEAVEAADPGELTLIEAHVVRHLPPSSSEDGDEQEEQVLVSLSLPEGDSMLRLVVPRSAVFFPTSKEALHRYREVMELLVSADETGDRANKAEIEFHMRLQSGSSARRENISPERDDDSSSSPASVAAAAAAAKSGSVDNVDSDTVILSGTRRIAENWFSLPRMLSLYYDFIVLDADHDGVLREQELRNYRNGALTPLAISRVFEAFAGAEQTITYTAYLDFAIATEYPHLAASQRYLWRLLDLEAGGNVLSIRNSLNFFAIEICRVLEGKNVISISPESLMAELLDMLRVGADAESVSFERDVLGSKMGGMVLPLLVDWHSFCKYESREQQRQMEQLDEETLGVEDEGDEEETADDEDGQQEEEDQEAQ